MVSEEPMTVKEMESYKPYLELVILARQAGFIIPEFFNLPTDCWAERKVSLMWLSLAKIKYLCEQKEKSRFADAYAEFNKLIKPVILEDTESSLPPSQQSIPDL